MNSNQPKNHVFNPNQSELVLIRIGSDSVGLIFHRFSSNELQNIFRIGYRIQISGRIGIVLIELE